MQRVSSKQRSSEAIADAAVANWGEAERADPTARFCFCYGMILTSVSDVGVIGYGEKRFGPFLVITPVASDDEAFEYQRTIVPSDKSPRRKRYLHRMEIRKRLPRRMRRLVRCAIRFPQYRFEDELQTGDKTKLRKMLGIDWKEFWRQCRKGPNADVPLIVRQTQQQLF